jgi:hypothetical protein
MASTALTSSSLQRFLTKECIRPKREREKLEWLGDVLLKERCVQVSPSQLLPSVAHPSLENTRLCMVLRLGWLQIVFGAASSVSHTRMSQVLDVVVCNRNLASSFDRLLGVSEHSQRFAALPAPLGGYWCFWQCRACASVCVVRGVCGSMGLCGWCSPVFFFGGSWRSRS